MVCHMKNTVQKKQKKIHFHQQKRKFPMWLLQLGRVKTELQTLQFPKSPEEGLHQCAALSDIALSLFQDQVRNGRTDLDDRQIALETQRLLNRLTQADFRRTLAWRKDCVLYFGR